MVRNIKKQIFLMELEEYLYSGSYEHLSRILEVGRIHTCEDAYDMLALVTKTSDSDALLKLAKIFHYMVMREQILAFTDTLTGLKNYNYLKSLELALSDKDFVLFFFDLDNMKFINDNLSHEAGNEAIRIFSEALKNSFRMNDVLVRYGGDEFVAIAFRGCLETDKVIERIQGHLDRSRLSEHIKFSVGRAVNVQRDLMKTLKIADNAMYKMKVGKKCSRSSSTLATQK